MPSKLLSEKRSGSRLASFTLVELLTVILIISILVGLVLMAGSFAMTKAKRARASGEIQAMAAALESYKTDNGVYPFTNLSTSYGISQSSTLLTNNGSAPYGYASKDGSAAGGNDYFLNSRVLYMGLSGKTNYTDTPVAGVRAYMSFSINQVGSRTSGTYVTDPWNYSYGYAIGNATSYPFNGTGFFDLWSTGGITAAQATGNNLLTNTWIPNWQ